VAQHAVGIGKYGNFYRVRVRVRVKVRFRVMVRVKD
jgi:hypothetical protein